MEFWRVVLITIAVILCVIMVVLWTYAYFKYYRDIKKY